MRECSSLSEFLSNSDSDVYAKYSVVFSPEHVRLELVSPWYMPRPLTRCFTRIKLSEQRTRRIRLRFFCISSASRVKTEVFMADFCGIFDVSHSNLWPNRSQPDVAYV